MGAYVFGPFRLDSDSRTLSLGATDLAVASKMVDTLLALVERAGEVCTPQQLIDRIWPEGFVEPAILTQNVYILRKLLREHWDAPAIETVRRRGYRFVAPLNCVPAAKPVTRPRSPRLHPAWRWSALVACAVFLIASLRYSTGPVQGTAAGLSAHSARLYAIGRYDWNSRTRAGVLKSVGYFQKIIHDEPSNALGYSGLADAYFTLADYHYGPPSPHTYHTWERAAVEKAYALNPNLSEVRTSRAQLLYSVDHDIAGAQREFLAAIQLDPHNAVAHHWYGGMLLDQGKLAQARAELETAVQLDPTSPAINRWVAIINYVTRRYGPAIAYYLQALDLKPNDDEATLMLGLTYEASGAYSAALRTYQHFEQLCACAAPLVLEARTLALMGKHEQARATLALAGTVRKQNAEPIDMAAALIALGERNQAMKWLRTFIRSDYSHGVWLKLDPRLDAARSDPYFKSLFAASRVPCELAC